MSSKVQNKPSGLGGRYIEVTVGLDGEVTIEPHGFTGPTCREATAELERRLGTVAHRDTKIATRAVEKQKGA